jgi:hypothetical protein
MPEEQKTIATPPERPVPSPSNYQSSHLLSNQSYHFLSDTFDISKRPLLADTFWHQHTIDLSKQHLSKQYLFKQHYKQLLQRCPSNILTGYRFDAMTWGPSPSAKSIATLTQHP